MKLSIVVPCYNEEENIPIILRRFQRAINGYPVEVVFVENGSTDNSANVFNEELRKPEYGFARVVRIKKNRGYGHGIMAGLGEAKGDVLAWTHADLQTDPADVISAYKKFCSLSCPYKIFIKGQRVNRKFGDWLFTFGMSVVASVVLQKLLFDINAQPKMFHRSFLEQAKNPPPDFSLDLYFLYMAKTFDYSIHTIPVRFGTRLHGNSKWAFSLGSRVRTIARTLKYILALRATVRGI